MKGVSYALSGAVFLADQLSKWWIIEKVGLEARETIPVLPFFSLTWVENRGVSMGLLTADSDMGRWLLVALTAAIAVVVAYWIWREQRRGDMVALALVLGGALGNIVDRVRFGYVVDFVHLHLGQWSFYVFNVADAAISIGVVVLLVRALFGGPDSGHSDRRNERLHDA
ncbi:signal peptidase II [Sandaracinobacteroides sp. A072]|uniref:signal peptidase II n=1 Tax=Sandaracinobacteroides sp. A072 TaxID=3461146 RepID=UPI0040411AD4